MSRPYPGPGQAEEGGRDAGAVLLGEGQDGPVHGGVQDEGEKLPGSLASADWTVDRVRKRLM